MLHKPKKILTKEQIEERIIAADSENGGRDAQVVHTFSGSLGEALRQDVSDFDDAEETMAAPANPGKIKRVLFTIFGVVVLVLAVIGAIATVNFSSSVVYELQNQTALKNEIAAFIYPVVTTDPPAFAGIEDLPTSNVVSSSIWSILMSGNTDSYETVYNYYVIIPSIDVEAAARSLFGYGFEIVHQTIADFEISFEYDEETQCYTVPKNPTAVAYSPAISDISCIGELYTVTVDYMAPTPMAIAGLRFESEPVKRMIYTISKTKNTMQINSISYVTADEGDGYIY